MTTILQTLRQEHRNIARLLDALEHQVEILAEGKRPDYDLLQNIATYFCDYPDRCHHPKEDAVFRRLQTKCPEQAAKVGDLASEHRSTAARVRRFRDNIQALFRDHVMPLSTLVSAAHTFIESERHHMHMEETIFFPVAESKLEPEDWQSIESTLTDARDPLFGEVVEKEFLSLLDRLLAWESEYRSQPSVAP
jgi:hemerythrin-like domain-containing protein